MKKELFVIFFFFSLSFIITVINLNTQIQGAQTQYSVANSSLDQPLHAH